MLAQRSELRVPCSLPANCSNLAAFPHSVCLHVPASAINRLVSAQPDLQLWGSWEISHTGPAQRAKNECVQKHKDCKAVRAAIALDSTSAGNYIPAAPIFLPEGPWKEIPGGVTAARGFKAAGTYGGLRASGKKPDLALVACDVDAIVAGTFTSNLVAAAPVLFCKEILKESHMARAVLVNAGQANAATGDAGYQDTVDCADAVAKLLGVPPNAVLIESTGVIGHRIKKDNLIAALPELVSSLSSDVDRL